MWPPGSVSARPPFVTKTLTDIETGSSRYCRSTLIAKVKAGIRLICPKYALGCSQSPEAL